ncbi:MAG: endonuclease MutS2 [Chloroflexi bacterium]|nr:endonuclease MutS2 [Chloroflexota bacterium]
METELPSPSNSQTGASVPLPDLRQRSLELLEFPRVRERLAQHTTLHLARELAQSLAPAYDPETVARLQQETSEACALLSQVGDVDLSGCPDVRPLLQRAARGGVLSGEELLKVQQAMEVVVRARGSVRGLASRTSLLRGLVRNIPDLRRVGQEIASQITASGEVADDASPYLGLLRNQSRAAYQRATEALNRLAQSPLGQAVLQDSFVTVRGGRLVLPVKAEMRERLPGIVHDISDSGATLFIEPFSTVRLCNAWRELVLEEEQESLRVLRALSTMVGRHHQEILQGLELAARLDLALAKARLARSQGGVAPQAAERGARNVRLEQGRHPLLKGEVVPVTLHLPPDRPVLVITGPNTGGKTVAMKTLGLLALMHQAGLHLPASPATRLPVFDGIYADIGDQQDIEQSLSTFSSHMRNIVQVLSLATGHSLVLLDELGTSTDPEEGSALAKAILSHLAERGVATVATTHHRNVAAFAGEHSGMGNASVDLDPVTLRPTYRVTMGLPGRSYAMEVSDRIGLSQNVLQRARELMDPAHLRTEALLVDLQREQQAARARSQEAEAAGVRAQELAQELERRVEELSDRQGQLLDETRHDLQARAQEVLARLRRAEAAAAWGEPRGAQVQGAREEVAQVQRQLRGRPWHPTPPGPGRPSLRAGDLVQVGGLGLVGQVLSPPDGRGRVEVRVGQARLSLDAGQLRKRGEAPAQPEVPVRVTLSPDNQLTGPEPDLDLRGLRVQEALEQLDRFLDQALARGRTRVRVVHGRGSGALRQAIWRHLSTHAAARSYAAAEPERGGEGATVVDLA